MGGSRTKKGTKGRRAVQHHKNGGKSAFFTEKEKEDWRNPPRPQTLPTTTKTWDTLSKNSTAMRNAYAKMTNDPEAAARMSDSEIKFNLNGMKTICEAGRKLADEDFCLKMMEDMYGMFIENGNEKMKQYMYLQGGLQLLELRDNDIGKGVYATADIPKGSVAGFYPCHYICLIKEGKELWAIPKDTEHTEESLQKYIDGEGRAYSMKCSSHKFIGDPKRVDDWWTLGHMINDRGYDGTEDYDPSARCNIIFDANFIFTAKDIKKGDELSVCYGSPYWFQGWSKKEGTSWHEKMMANKISD